MKPIQYLLWLNPEPWAIGSISGKRISPNLNLKTYQMAVKEALQDVPMLPDNYRKITFYFFRQLDRYIDMSDRVRQRNIADATNCQKALEDALQGILFDNDREVLDIRSVMSMQGADVTDPCILIKAEYSPSSLVGMDEIDDDLLEQINAGRPVHERARNRWDEADDLF